jgi:hypothetical protein
MCTKTARLSDATAAVTAPAAAPVPAQPPNAPSLGPSLSAIEYFHLATHASFTCTQHSMSKVFCSRFP